MQIRELELIELKIINQSALDADDLIGIKYEVGLSVGQSDLIILSVCQKYRLRRKLLRYAAGLLLPLAIPDESGCVVLTLIGTYYSSLLVGICS